MKVRLEIDADTDTGDWGVRFRNVSNPGVGIESKLLNKLLLKILDDMIDQVEEVETRLLPKGKS